MSITGRIHSIETCGTVDGPGLRVVMFTQGCPLRCLYCHNPDCREISGGTEVTADEIVAEIQKYRSYIRPPGGVTISGGEPLMQPAFVQEILRQCKALGIHTALDTSGYCPLAIAHPVLEFVDLVLLDIKSFDPSIYTQVTSVSLQPTLDFAQYLSDCRKPAWIRFVVVPGLTDSLDNVSGLAQFVARLKNVERIEIIPFHKMGEYKWQQLGYDYQLSSTPTPTPECIQAIRAQFQQVTPALVL